MKRNIPQTVIGVTGVALILNALILPFRSFHYFVSPLYEKISGQSLLFIIVTGLMLVVLAFYGKNDNSFVAILELYLTIFLAIWLLSESSPKRQNPYEKYNQFEIGYYIDVFLVAVLFIAMIINKCFTSHAKK